MKFRTIVVFCLTFILLCPDLFPQTPGIFDLSGTWQFRKQGTTKIYNGKVPGCIHTDLYRNNIIPNPFFGDNEAKLQWISDTGWVYERYFTLNTDFFSNRSVELVCEGLDTYANV